MQEKRRKKQQFVGAKNMLEMFVLRCTSIWANFIMMILKFQKK